LKKRVDEWDKPEGYSVTVCKCGAEVPNGKLGICPECGVNVWQEGIKGWTRNDFKK